MSVDLPHLLQVAPAFAATPMSGAELRSRYLAAGLARQMRVTHVGFAPANTPVHTERETRFIPVTRARTYRRTDLLRGACGPVPFPVLNYTRDNMKAALRDILDSERIDIVQLESIHLAGYLPLLRPAAAPRRFLLCDWHNIESEVLGRTAEAQASRPKRLYIRRQAALLERYERWFVGQCDAHLVVSERDRAALLRYGVTAPVMLIDNGVDVPSFSEIAESQRHAEAARKRVLFVGSMDYAPNIEAVTQFARDSWPEIRRSLPDAMFSIVGRNPAPTVRALAGEPGIEVTGSVPDVRPYYRDAAVMVVPLRVGGGTRLKILEAMAAGLPVVSTALGAEGLEAVPETHYFLADTAAAMSMKVVAAWRRDEKVRRVALAGYELAKQRYDWRGLGDSLASQVLALATTPRVHAAAAV